MYESKKGIFNSDIYFRFVDRGTRHEAWNSSDFHVRLRASRIRKPSHSTTNIKPESVTTKGEIN